MDVEDEEEGDKELVDEDALVVEVVVTEVVVEVKELVNRGGSELSLESSSLPVEEPTSDLRSEPLFSLLLKLTELLEFELLHLLVSFCDVESAVSSRFGTEIKLNIN